MLITILNIRPDKDQNRKNVEIHPKAIGINMKLKLVNLYMPPVTK